MRIANENVAVAVDAQAAGPTIAVVGRGPAGAEEMAVAVEHLNASGEIDNVEAILRVDGDGARPHEIAGPDAFLAPDDFRPRRVARTAGQGQGRAQNPEDRGAKRHAGQ